MSGISLTAAMRSNLLSLQNIAGRQNIVQNRLATGLKVSSAIDNPSSYYTASSLSSRAADLTALLDAMSQGIQTIKSASEAIDAGIKFLEQAKAVADQALETAVPAKEWFIEQVGENGAVVETAQELLDAVNTGKETIVVYGRIELENQNIDLQNGQKLVGTEYFTGTPLRNRDSSRFSQITIRNDNASGINMAGNCRLSDLDITFRSSYSFSAVTISSSPQKSIMADVNIDAASEQGLNIANAAIGISSQAHAVLDGKINLKHNNYAIFNNNSSYLEIKETATITISAYYGITNYSGSETHIYGQIKFTDISGSCFFWGADYSSHRFGNNRLYLYDIAKIDFTDTNISFVLSGCMEGRSNTLTIEDGCLIRIQEKSYKAEDLKIIHNATSSYTITPTLLLTLSNAKETPFWEGSNDFIGINTKQKLPDITLLLTQYNALIGDASYKGINLLDGQKLKINFNEDRSAQINVMGVKADSDSLGLKTKEWTNAGDIEQSVSELEGAINTLRNYASQYGNYYSIVTTRQDFTENLINVLEEGADKLTLADMNQEAANMLALQTSQQLAVNSLSLASQAAQAVLRLF